MVSEHGVYGGVSVDHPRIVDTIHKMKKDGRTKEDAMRIVGMPMEVIDRHWQTAPK